MHKIIFALTFALFFIACSTDADDGDDFDAAVVCPTQGLNKYGEPNRGTFVDERDGQEYKYATIGDQVWMAQNLNYESERSVCVDLNEENCSKYGRLYNVQIDGLTDTSVDTSFVDTICPKGWHLPNKKEFKQMLGLFEGNELEVAASRLKSSSLWEKEKLSGSDVCDLSFLPSGQYWPGHSNGIGIAAIFATSTAGESYCVDMIKVADVVSEICFFGNVSIRCVKD